jgi:predicted dithiol-disulfide oxidoreductase (DUF899 family)
MSTQPIVSPQQWEAARQELLVKEKELTRARDALAAERRQMPHKDYRFEGPAGPALGRQETWEDSPEGYPQTLPYEWWHLHDEYGEPA